METHVPEVDIEAECLLLIAKAEKLYELARQTKCKSERKRLIIQVEGLESDACKLLQDIKKAED